MVVPLGVWLIGWHRAVSVLLIASVITGGGLMAIRERALSHSFIAPYLDKKISLLLVASVRTDPKLGQPKQMIGYLKPASTTALVSAISIEVGGKVYKAHLPFRLTTASRISFLPGTVISARGILYSTSEKRVAALFAQRGVITVIHGASAVGRLTGQIRSDFRQVARSVGGESGALIPGLVLGDTSLESHDFVNNMLSAGLTHLTAVSGENFAILAAFMFWFLQWFVKSFRIRLLISALVLIAFIFLVRPSPSVLRATVMVSVLMIAKARGVKSSAVPALGLAIAVLILIDPFEAIDPGFALSIAATAGILLLSQPIARWIFGYLHREKLAQLLAIPISANVLCTPLAIAISGQFSFMSLPSNLLVEPAVGPITIVGFVAALLSPVWPGVAYLVALTQKPFAAEIVWVAHTCAKVPVIHLSKGFLGAGIGLLVTMCGWIAIRWRSWGSH